MIIDVNAIILEQKEYAKGVYYILKIKWKSVEKFESLTS